MFCIPWHQYPSVLYFYHHCFFDSLLEQRTNQRSALLTLSNESTGSRWIHNHKKAFNTLRPRQNGRHFADDTFKRISLNEYIRICIKISLKSVHKSPIDNIPALFQIMAWRRPGDKPLSEAMMVSVLTHICVVRPQWVNAENVSMSCVHQRLSSRRFGIDTIIHCLGLGYEAMVCIVCLSIFIFLW